MRTLTQWGACAVLVLAAACGGAAPRSADAPEPSRIARVHASRCGSCHVRVEPGERTRAELETALSRHRRRVRLSEDDWARMVDYLAARDVSVNVTGASVAR